MRSVRVWLLYHKSPSIHILHKLQFIFKYIYINYISLEPCNEAGSRKSHTSILLSFSQCWASDWVAFFFALKEEQRMALWLYSEEKMFSLKTQLAFSIGLFNTAAHRSLPGAGEAHLVSPLAPLGSCC